MKISQFLLVSLLCSLAASSQEPDEKFLLKAISNRDNQKAAGYYKTLVDAYDSANAAGRNIFLIFFTVHCTDKDPYVASRSLLWAGYLRTIPPINDLGPKIFDNDTGLLKQAINKAVESGDEYLMMEIFEQCADRYRRNGRREQALFYYLKAGEMRKGKGEIAISPSYNFYSQLSELLFAMQEYKEAENSLRQVLIMPMPVPSERLRVNAYNTLALCFQRAGNYDSALHWFEKTREFAGRNRDTVWMGIAKGNIGAVYFEQRQYDRALPLLWDDYYTTLKYGETNSAGNTLHRIAIIYLSQNKKDSALMLARKSLQLTAGKQDLGFNVNYIRNAYYSLSEVFKSAGQADSAAYYGTLYDHLKDSLELAVARSRADVVQTKFEFEKSSNRINNLLNEKQAEKTRRNLLLAGLLLVIISGWFYFRWQRQRFKTKQQALVFEKEKAEAEIKNAKQQLNEFTHNIIDKNEMIEKLQTQLQQQNMQLNEELLNQSILTENDWLRFKDMFEKANPGFIQQLQKAAPDITTAEIRYATLIYLNLGSKHIASMLGIGADAVRKTRQRLRQRLNIAADENALEEFIKNIRGV
ncbi:MAG: tetratricopeptide repeat protein [Chitinophagaceae bacterium]|nr:tetratricopeptide repeat protein [Chitinophagaceae bacterium]